MPDKTDEERERIAKKLAEQRAKIEGMPTTAKVRAGFITNMRSRARYEHMSVFYISVVFTA